MVEQTKRTDDEVKREAIDLRNPFVAGLLAWLFPGAGHWYQRRYFKAVLFAICIWPILIAGLVMGSYREETSDGGSQIHFARTLYCSWRPGDRRLYFIPQACVGCVALPAMWQARFPGDADGSILSTAFAPPRVSSEYGARPNQPDANDIARRLHSWLDLSVIFTVVAGLLNLLAIFDAVGGPAPVDKEGDQKKDEKEKDGEKAEKK
ncbi:MAG: hypothetical protein IKX88_07320 [Thermoguttaceae bacterium]|nr:hypothetical protein [Thermoguttaceae bacterium]